MNTSRFYMVAGFYMFSISSYGFAAGGHSSGSHCSPTHSSGHTSYGYYAVSHSSSHVFQPFIPGYYSSARTHSVTNQPTKSVHEAMKDPKWNK